MKSFGALIHGPRASWAMRNGRCLKGLFFQVQHKLCGELHLLG